MITCTCGKQMERLPTWLASVNVEFICNNCPNRVTKNIAFVNFDSAITTPAEKKEEVEEAVAEEPKAKKS